MPRDFKAALGEANRVVEEAHGAQATERVRERLRKGSPRRRRVRWGRVAGAAAAMGLAVMGAVSVRAPERSFGRYTVLEGDLGGRVDGALLAVRSGHGVLRDEGLGAELEVSAGTQLRSLDDGVELVTGQLSLDVDHSRARAVPFRVRVSHGAIEVLGTRFVVVQRAGAGEVTLLRGSIRFVADDGQRRVLTPGETLQWPLPAVAVEPAPPPPPPTPIPPVPPLAQPRPKVKPTAPLPVPAPAPALDVGQVLDEVALLRSRGEYEEAVKRLTRALDVPHAPATDERLSFELGSVLGRQLHDAVRACTHWSAHLRRFPDGRYKAEVAQARVELRCP